MRLNLAQALDVPLRSAAARRTDQPPGPGRGDLAGGMAVQVSGHPAADFARPRFSGRRHRPHPPYRAEQGRTSMPAIIPRSRSRAPSSSPSSSPLSRSSSAKSRTFKASSTASGPRPPRPGRRRAGSRRWSGWS